MLWHQSSLLAVAEDLALTDPAVGAMMAAELQVFFRLEWIVGRSLDFTSLTLSGDGG